MKIAYKELFDKDFNVLIKPLLMEQVLMTIITNINVYLFSLFSDNIVAAIGISDQIIAIATMILGIISLGSTILFIQYADIKFSNKINKILSESLILNIIFSIIIILVINIFANNIVNLMNTPNELKSLSQSYLKISSISLLFLGITNILIVLNRSFGHVKSTKNVIIINTSLVIIGNVFCIMFPISKEYMIIQVAISMVITRFIGMCISIFVTKNNLREIISIKNVDSPKNLTYTFQILSLGLPSAMESISYNIYQTIITAIIASIGTTVVTSKIYVQTITSFIFSIGVAAALAGQIRLGKYIREEKYKSIVKFILTNTKVFFIIAILINVFLAIVSPFVLRLFTNDQSIIGVSIILMIMQIFNDPLRVSNEILVTSLHVLKEVNYPLILSLVTTYIVKIPLAYLFTYVFNMGIYGIWLTFILDELIRCLLYVKKLKNKEWKFDEIHK